MKRNIPKLILVACLTVSPVLLLAQAKGTGDVPERIAVLNIQQAIGETNEGREAMAVLQKKYQPRQQDLQQQEKEINDLQDKLQAQGNMLNNQERYDLNQELDRKQRHLKEAQDDAQADYQDDTQAAVRQIGQKMVKLISQYAPEHHFALVIGDQQIPVYYVSKAVDITADIVALYNRTYPLRPAAAAASSPAPSAKPAK